MTRAFALLQVLLLPLVEVWFWLRLARGKEDRTRWRERFGHGRVARPAGPLLWLHGASVGEGLSVLPLVATLLDARPDLTVLITTGTRTSGELLTKRLAAPPYAGRVLHHYAPLDLWPYVRRFYAHWAPTVSVFIESEFWPELLGRAPNPVLINARMSERSFHRYARVRGWIGPLLGRFRLCLAQTDADADRLRALGAPHVRTAGNLKYDAPPLPADGPALAVLKHAVGTRPVLMFASTHAPEETLAARLHQVLAPKVPGLLTLVAPRHPQRGDTLATELRAQGLTVALRSAGDPLTASTDLYLANTIGDMGLWYRLARVAVMGGSYLPHGGQNPLEPLRLGVPTLCGPHMHNFRDMVALLTAQGALTVCPTPATLADALLPLLTDRTAHAAAVARLTPALHGVSGATDRVADALLSTLTEVTHGAA